MEWITSKDNERRAANGLEAVKVGQEDNYVHNDPWTSGLDTLTNVLHWLGSKGYSRDEIGGMVEDVLTNYDAERTGEE